MPPFPVFPIMVCTVVSRDKIMALESVSTDLVSRHSEFTTWPGNKATVTISPRIGLTQIEQYKTATSVVHSTYNIRLLNIVLQPTARIGSPIKEILHWGYFAPVTVAS